MPSPSDDGRRQFLLCMSSCTPRLWLIDWDTLGQALLQQVVLLLSFATAAFNRGDRATG